MFAVVVRTGVVVVVFERHVLCAFGGQVSEARVECTFLANDAAYLTLSRAVTQLRRSEIVTPGVGLTVCVVCGVSNESVGFGRAFSLQSQSECIISERSQKYRKRRGRAEPYFSIPAVPLFPPFFFSSAGVCNLPERC